MTESTDEIRRWIVRNHRPTVEATIAVAKEVGSAPDETTDRVTGSPRTSMQRAFEDRGLPERYAGILRAVRTRFRPGNGPDIVPAPPYVTTTSRGPLLRLPGERGRLVIELAVFAVVPGNPVFYRRRGDEPEKVVTVRWRGTDDGRV